MVTPLCEYQSGWFALSIIPESQKVVKRSIWEYGKWAVDNIKIGSQGETVSGMDRTCDRGKLSSSN